MESHYEDQSPAAVGSTGYKKTYIDFYRQNENFVNKNQVDSQQYSTQKEVYEELMTSGGAVGGGLGAGALLDNQIFRQEVDHKLFNQINTADNYVESHLKGSMHEGRKEEYKKVLQDNKAAGLKRRSLENNEAMYQNKNRQNDVRQMISGAKSAMNYYGTQSQGGQGALQGGLKQLNKNKIVEMDGQLNNNQQQQLFQNNNSISQQQQQKRTLAKSQSQNRLLLVAPETIMNKNNPYPGDMYIIAEGVQSQDKCSFSEQSQGGRVIGGAQDLLFKQHLQYSTGNGGHHSSKSWQLKAKNNQILSHLSTKECTFCNKTGGIHSHSLIPPLPLQCSAIYCIKDSLGLMIQNNLSKKYSTNRDYYNLKIVNDLIYNENTHIVSIFKDYLILDDINEFLKRSYTYSETKTRLPKLCSFYDKYSQVFPNYVILPESKYMFKNIQRKQKLIDEQYQIQEQQAQRQHQTLMNEDRLFNSQFYNSVYRANDLSMSRQQYEEQAKSIATMVGRQQKVLRIDQMKIDELVDRFLMKDSESNIQLITTAGLDFSGFTHQSTFINENKGQTPNKQLFKLQPPKEQSSNKQSVVSTKNSQKNTAQAVGQRKESLPQTQQPQQKKSAIAYNAVTQANKKQKGSFNNNQQQQQLNQQQQKTTAVKPIDTNKAAMSNASSSTKTTPRLQKSTPYIVNTHEDQPKLQQIQTSPATKEAIQNYLHNCQIESTHSANLQDQLHIQVLDQVGLEPMKSPHMQSPQFNPQKLLASSASQTALSQQMASSSLSTNNRQNLKSQQCVIPTIQLNQNCTTGKEITNLKKTTRLSAVGTGGSTGQQKTTPINKKQNIANVSPMPITTLQTQQQLTSSSRNLVSNSTQKSLKSVNSHAKYLSGGNDQYQRLLQHQQQSSTIQNPYATHDTIHSATNAQNNFSTKKQSDTLPKMETFHKQQQHQQPFEMGDEGAITGEDCDEAGIADERFASPEIFSTTDDNAGRKSIQRQQIINAGNGFGQIMLTSCEDNRILSQCNNYDQIKKHLEQYITINQHSEQSSNKKYIATMGSTEKLKLYESESVGYNKNQLAQSAGGDVNNSRNGTAQKHFESLKQKIRGVFDAGTDSSVSASANKTPNKSSTHSKKQVQQPTNAVLSQNRMSIESKDMLIIGAGGGPTPQNQGCLSSTSAGGRSLGFNQFNNPNYRSITNLQQRKNSGNSKQQHDGSIEGKRLSQNRQSFKEMQQMQQDKLKRCATGKTLSINDINHHTFGNIIPQGNSSGTGYLSSTATLCNPTFISATSSHTNNNNPSKLYNQQMQNSQAIHQQQQNASQQAANTVRVMTPSYSLASLSKLISPTQSTSPITMTVTLAGQQHRKQVSKKQQAHPQNHHQANTVTNFQVASSSQHQNFLLADKNSKLIGTKGHQTTNLVGKSHRTLTAAQISQPKQQTQIQPKVIQAKLQSSGSSENFQITPRNMPQQNQHHQQHHQQQINENSQNLSCTISTENNSSNIVFNSLNLAAKAVESKNPKFMKTIEEFSNQQQQQQYNTMLSATIGHRKSGTGLCNSVSQAQLDTLKQRQQKIQTVVNSNQATIKRSTGGIPGGTMTLSSSASVSHFKSPSQQIQTKKQIHGRYI